MKRRQYKTALLFGLNAQKVRLKSISRLGKRLFLSEILQKIRKKRPLIGKGKRLNPLGF
ncbi:hypothetical protein appser2_19210 [Actinobacillus pleuropneumoniae serovar 2 str. S1536]|nr:hypothetical protein appser2_19210 [Actinobacillus pleuropneumoniae serovar 2 str. S1536]